MPKLSLNASKKTKHTPAGEIPVDWAFHEMGELASIRSGGTPSKANAKYWDGNVPWLSAKDQKSFRVKTSIDKISPLAVENGARLVPAGSILVLVRGMMLLKCFPVAVAEVAVTFNQDLKAIIADERRVLSIYLAYFLDSHGEQIRTSTTLAGHGTGRLALEVLVNLLIPLPPIPEQRRIAGIISSWERAIETLESLIAAKSRRKQALMQQLLSGKKRLPGFSGRWSQRHLGDVAENVSLRNNGKFSWDRLYAVTKADGMVPMREQVMGVSTNNCKLVKRNFFAYNPMRLNIGSLARWQRDEDVMVSGDYIVFRCREGELEPRFFDHLRRTTHWHDFVNVGGSGSVRVRLYFKDIAPFKFPCPEFNEQKALADFFDTIDRELTLHRQHLDSLRTQKRGLMQKLLTGEVRTKSS